MRREGVSDARRDRASIPLLGLLLVVLLAGLGALLELRFRFGDVYPAYSSLRADPMGSRLLYEGLAAQPNLAVERALRPPRHGQPDATYLYLGLDVESPGWGALGLEGLARDGARVVLAFRPLSPVDNTKAGKVIDQLAPKKANEKPDELWGTRFGRLQDSELPEWELGVSRRTALYFVPQDKAWRVLAERKGHPVEMERPWGSGSLVLVAPSFFLTNEALVQARETPHILRVLGTGKHVIFEETHLGVSEQESLMAMVRRYGLLPLLASLLLVTALFLWQQSSSLLPPRANPAEERLIVAHRDASEGLTMLLTRAIPVSKLIDAARQQWLQTRTLNRPYSTLKQRRLQELAAVPGEPVAVYESIRRMLAERESS